MISIRRATATAALVALMGAAPAWAEYPQKSVTMIVPFGTGGAADLAARIMANEAPEYLGENLLVVNQTGAGGVTGSTAIAKGPKDGYQVLMARVGSQATVPAMNETIPYTWDEFTMLGLIELNPFAVAVNVDSPYQTFEDLAEAIAAGERLSSTSGGIGTLPHMAALILVDAVGGDTSSHVHIPFKGGGDAVTAVISGNGDFTFFNLSALIGPIESGQLRPLLVTTPERVALAADVPTASELGYPALGSVIGWSGVWAAPDLDPAAREKWISVLDHLKTDASWIESTEKLGSIPTVLSPDETREFVRQQYETFRQVAEKLGMIVR